MYDPLPALYQSQSHLLYMTSPVFVRSKPNEAVRLPRHPRYHFLLLLLLVLSVTAWACSGTEETNPAKPVTPQERINMMLEKNDYRSALALLSTAREEREDGDEPDLHELSVQVHLAYANYLTHEADHLAMGARMGNALRHYRRVLALDPGNTLAQTHIELIEGIYEQMGREIPQGIAE